MKTLSPSLLTIAASLLAVPLAQASTVKNDDLSLGLRLQLQVRAEKGWARGVYRDTSTSPWKSTMWNATENVAGEPDDMDFYVRRARIGFSGTWRQHYKFSYILRNDNQDRAGSSVSTSNRIPQTHVAFIERVIKQEDLGLEHGLRAGLDYAWFNGASAVFSSSSFLFPTARATDQGALLAPRGVGVGYKLSHKMFALGLDVRNNTGDNATATGTNPQQGSANQGEGLFYGARVHFIPFDSDAKGHMRPVESFVGKEGTGVLISAEFGVNQNDNTSPTQTVNTKAYGFEVLAHWNALTALAEWRQAIRNTDNRTGADARRVANAYLFQAGYALPLGDQFIEPAFRVTRLNLNAAVDEIGHNDATVANNNLRVGGGYGSSADYGTSGTSYELGVNYYIHAHSNKLQLAWQHWRAEAAARVAGENRRADADIVRLQWQLNF